LILLRYISEKLTFHTVWRLAGRDHQNFHYGFDLLL